MVTITLIWDEQKCATCREPLHGNWVNRWSYNLIFLIRNDVFDYDWLVCGYLRAVSAHLRDTFIGFRNYKLLRELREIGINDNTKTGTETEFCLNDQ